MDTPESLKMMANDALPVEELEEEEDNPGLFVCARSLIDAVLTKIRGDSAALGFGG